MQSKKIEITDYDYQFPLSSDPDMYAFLNLYKENSAGITVAAQIRFYYGTIPANTLNRVDFENARASTSLPAAMLPQITDLLRNEKPVFIWFYSNNNIRLSSFREDVGDNDQA